MLTPLTLLGDRARFQVFSKNGTVTDPHNLCTQRGLAKTKLCPTPVGITIVIDPGNMI